MVLAYGMHCLQLQAGLSLGLVGMSVTMPLVWLLLVLLVSSLSPNRVVVGAVALAGWVST